MLSALAAQQNARLIVPVFYGIEIGDNLMIQISILFLPLGIYPLQFSEENPLRDERKCIYLLLMPPFERNICIALLEPSVQGIILKSF